MVCMNLKNVRHPSRIIIVEGYMDVVALAQYGVDYAVTLEHHHT